jgi:HK97 family phage major capsid protein
MAKITKAAQLVAALTKGHGYDGDGSKDSVLAFLAEKGIEPTHADGSPIDVEALYAPQSKAVKITVEADAGEEVAVNGEALAAEAEEPAQASAEPAKAFHKVQNATFNIGRSNAERKAYNARAKNASLKGDDRPVYSDADLAEYAGAWLRYTAFKGFDTDVYGQKANDLAIIKTMVGSNNALGGNLVPRDFAPFLIENVNKYGAARKLVGVTPMARDVLPIPSIDSDVDVNWVGEATAGNTNASAPTFGQAQLVAKKILGTKRVSSEIFNDSAIAVADLLSRSFSRALAKKEDQAYFLGDGTSTYGGFSGLSSAIGTAGFVNGTGNSWSALVRADINKALGTVSSRFADRSQWAMACSPNFYWTVLHPMIQAAGGATMAEAQKGLESIGRGNADFIWDGVPGYFVSVMPTATATSSKVLYVGNFAAATKLGEVRGSMGIESSNQRYFDTDEVVFRAVNRVAITCHDVGDSSNAGGIVGLMTTS